MRAIRSKGTKLEIVLGKALWAKGYRYRKNDPRVFGKPDLTFRKYKVAIFVDSEFFHGKDWENAKYSIKSRRDFWWRKIEGNIERDTVVNARLRQDGWTILRFWSLELKRDLASSVQKIQQIIEQRKNAEPILAPPQKTQNKG